MTGFGPDPLYEKEIPSHVSELAKQVNNWPVSSSARTPFIELYIDPDDIVMFVGAVCHVGLWLVVMAIVLPTDSAGEPLSVAQIRRLHCAKDSGAVKLMSQLSGDGPKPLASGVKPTQLVPFDEQVSNWPKSLSLAVPFVWLYREPPDIVMSVGAVCHLGARLLIVTEIVAPTVSEGLPLSAT